MKKSFINPHIKNQRRGLKEFFLWKVGYYDDEEPLEKEPSSFCFPKNKGIVSASQPSVRWVNHCTFLLNIGGLHVLTDPIWSDRCSPFKFVGPKRMHPPGISLAGLPKIDIVLISHNHYDHLDKKTVLALSRLFPQIIWFVPKGVKQWFDRLEISPVYELGWWEERDLSPVNTNTSFKLTAVPAQHFSGRGLFDRNCSLWVGWVLECEIAGEKKKCYFAGDTGYNSFDFVSIGERFGSIDLSMIPIGTYRPSAFMHDVHIDPVESVRIHQEVGSRLSIGMHWKTFHLSEEPIHRPPYDLYLALQRAQVDPSQFLLLDPGEGVNW